MATDQVGRESAPRKKSKPAASVPGSERALSRTLNRKASGANAESKNGVRNPGQADQPLVVGMDHSKADESTIVIGRLRPDGNLEIIDIKRKRGRPRGDKPFDKKAHDRIKSAERRARLKAQKEQGE